MILFIKKNYSIHAHVYFLCKYIYFTCIDLQNQYFPTNQKTKFVLNYMSIQEVLIPLQIVLNRQYNVLLAIST